MARPAADPDAYDEAVEWFRQRAPMTDLEFDAMIGRSHERAFKVAGVAHLDVVKDVWEALDDALAKGSTLEDFRGAVEAKLTAAWGGAQPYRVETIFRTNLQHSYSRGRWEQQTDPAVKDLRPFWQYAAVLDDRTTEVCRRSNGTVLTVDDPWWQSHNPPCHHACRSTIISLTREQAEAKGLAPAGPSVPADEGFGGAPGADDWHVDLSKYPHELAAEAGAKAVAG